MRVAVRELRLRRRSGWVAAKIWEILPTAVVADQVDGIDVHCIEELLEHRRLGVIGDVLCRFDLRRAMGHQIEGNTSARTAQVGQLMPPEVTVEQDTVHEERHRAFAVLDVTDLPRGRGDGASLRFECCAVHRDASVLPVLSWAFSIFRHEVDPADAVAAIRGISSHPMRPWGSLSWARRYSVQRPYRRRRSGSFVRARPAARSTRSGWRLSRALARGWPMYRPDSEKATRTEGNRASVESIRHLTPNDVTALVHPDALLRTFGEAFNDVARRRPPSFVWPP